MSETCWLAGTWMTMWKTHTGVVVGTVTFKISDPDEVKEWMKGGGFFAVSGDIDLPGMNKSVIGNEGAGGGSKEHSHFYQGSWWNNDDPDHPQQFSFFIDPETDNSGVPLQPLRPGDMFSGDYADKSHGFVRFPWVGIRAK
jgi:hypothetical protein